MLMRARARGGGGRGGDAPAGGEGDEDTPEGAAAAAHSARDEQRGRVSSPAIPVRHRPAPQIANAEVPDPCLSLVAVLPLGRWHAAPSAVVSTSLATNKRKAEINRNRLPSHTGRHQAHCPRKATSLRPSLALFGALLPERRPWAGNGPGHQHCHTSSGRGRPTASSLAFAWPRGARRGQGAAPEGLPPVPVTESAGTRTPGHRTRGERAAAEPRLILPLASSRRTRRKRRRLTCMLILGGGGFFLAVSDLTRSGNGSSFRVPAFSAARTHRWEGERGKKRHLRPTTWREQSIDNLTTLKSYL